MAPKSTNKKFYLSKKLHHAVKLSNYRQYELAKSIDIHPAVLSKHLLQIEKVEINDPKYIRLGQILGVPKNELFEIPHK